MAAGGSLAGLVTAREAKAQEQAARATRGTPSPIIKDVSVIATQPGGSRLVVAKITTDQAGLYGYGCGTFTQRADLVLLAMGFVHVVHSGLVDALGLALDQRGNAIVNDDFMTSREGIFAAGDAVDGASLVVKAIHAGRQAAAAIDRWLRK